MKKKALITGVTGQDGAYLAELLLAKDYEVHGLKRRASSFNTERVDHLIRSRDDNRPGLKLHYGDMTDGVALSKLIGELKPDEIYNLAAQSHVAVSFEAPEYTANADGIGALRILEAMRSHRLTDKTRFYQASTSELFGGIENGPQSETSPFHPRSPYGVAKLYAYWIAVNYREAYGMFAVNGILFNHESPLRGETFVTRKITRALARIWHGLEKQLRLGNLDARRDWGHAKDFVRAQWMMLQHPNPMDFVIATGVQNSVRDFVNAAAEYLGVTLEWRGLGAEEHGVVMKLAKPAPGIQIGDVIIRVDPTYYRPAEVSTLLGDASKAKNILGWQPEIGFQELVHDMMHADMELVEFEAKHGVARYHWRVES